MGVDLWQRWSGLRNALVLIALWEVVGQFKLVAGGALPSLSAIVLRLWVDRADYPGHIWATLSASASGFLIGNTVAILAGVLFVIFPVLLRITRGLNIAIFALPPSPSRPSLR